MTDHGSAPGTRAAVPVLGLAAVVLVALSLRGPVSSVGPLLEELRSDLGLEGVTAALLPTLPLLCFGALALTAPALSRRLGLHRAVLAGSGVLCVGIALRAAGTWGLFTGTLLVGSGIAVVNVLLPAVVKSDFVHHLPLATGLTTSSMALSASLGAGLAQPLREVTGGPVSSLAVWLAPAAVGLLAWFAVTRHRRGSAAAPARIGLLPLLRDRVALAVTAFFGLQSLAFYTLLAWLPSVLRDAGVGATRAGVMLAVAALFGVPVAFVVPRLAAGRPEQGRYVLLVALPTAVGLLGLLLAPAAAPWVWSVLLGVGTGAAFPLALTIILLRSADSAQAARLSAVVQGAGYVICATGPILIGVLHDASGGWTVSLLALLALLLAQVVVGW